MRPSPDTLMRAGARSLSSSISGISSSAAKANPRPTKAERMRESKRPGDRDAYEERLRYELKFLNYAPIVFISAQTGKGTEKIFPLLEEVATERRKRITTSEMNRFIEHVDFERASVPMR